MKPITHLLVPRLTLCSSCLQLRPGLQARPRQKNHNYNNFHATNPLPQSSNTSNQSSYSSNQALPLGDYYTSLLSDPSPNPQSNLRSQTSPQHPTATPLPSFVPSGDLTKEQRAARLFGSVSGSGYQSTPTSTSTWQTINNVPIPPRPMEPDNCCMSGCVHCVWDDYRDDIEGWAVRVKEAQAKGQRTGNGTGSGGKTKSPKIELHRTEVADAAGSMDDDGGGSEGLWDTPSVSADSAGAGEDLFQGIPVGIREFMATEKRIRERKRKRKNS